MRNAPSSQMCTERRATRSKTPSTFRASPSVSTDEIEQIGISRTYAAIEKARIVLWLLDSEPAQNELQDIIERTKDKSLIIIQNKIDKSSTNNFDNIQKETAHKYTFIKISAKQGTNIDDLELAIYQAAQLPTISDSDVIVTNARHYDALLNAHDAVISSQKISDSPSLIWQTSQVAR